MKKNLFLAALALTALAGCTDESYVGNQSQLNTNEGGAISFRYNIPNATRGENDHNTLNNQFIVWGEKNETSDNLITAAGEDTRVGDLVFPNYIVNYVASSAYTTTSNTNNWEYVGFKFDDSNANPSTANYTSYVTPNTKPTSGDAPAQTIKYWDNAASSYTFTAVSAKHEDISAGRVQIAKTKSGSNTVTSVYGKGYTITLAKDGSNNYPSLTDLYFADRINIAKGEGYTHNVVQFNFRNTLSHVRVGMYETIPGYEISEIKFYKTDGTTEYNDGASTPVSAFGAVCPNVSATNFEGTVNVSYYDGSNHNIQNHPKVTVTPNNGVAKTDLVLGTNFSTLTTGATPKYLGTEATHPTYDTETTPGVGEYTSVLPQINNDKPLQLKVNYKLYDPVTKEVIQITGKTANIPAQYLQWKANYKYTYLFKITDDDLNPITFDAVITEAENGQAEYITTVTEPSITTFGWRAGFCSIGKNEYEEGSDIYATFMQGTSVLTPQGQYNNKANYIQVYAVDYKEGATDAEKAEKPITELSVANAIAHADGLIKTTVINNATNDYFGNSPQCVTQVPSEDGVGFKNIAALELQNAKKAGKYAIEITTYDAVTLTVGAELNGYYSINDNSEYTKLTAGTYSSGTYYKQVKTYKVITVVEEPNP